MKEKEKRAHMRSAFNYADLSHCKKRKVGCVIVNNGNLVYGYNGTPTDWDNCCEEEHDNTKTKPEVIHAELNAIAKIAQSPISSEGASAFLSYRPCLPCAILLRQSGIKEVYYAAKHRDGKDPGIDFLEKCGIVTEHLQIEE